jgi:hypothetical protein
MTKPAKYQLHQEPKRPHAKVIGVVFLTGLAVFASAWAIWYFHSKAPTSITKTTKTSTVSAQPSGSTVASVQGRYLFNGTVVWAREVERNALRANGSYDYAKPFSQLNTFNRTAYDAWATDFECPITNNVVPFRTQVDNLVFNCRPEFLPEASKYFNLFDLANNHTDNQGGITGLTETRQHLAATPGVQYFGSFDPSVAGDICEVVAMPVRLQRADKTEEKASLPIAMCAWHYFYRTPQAGEIEVMKQYAKIMPVFAFVEMGTEYHAAANDTQKNIAHAVIDQGPEFLIANNPHWVQNTEVYKNKLIVYSTGNFIFDQLDAETQRSASIDVTATVPYNDNVAKWVALGATCSKYQDDCLQKAQAQNLQKISLALKYGVVAGQGGADKITHKADATTQAAVEQRLNWATSLKQLGQN